MLKPIHEQDQAPRDDKRTDQICLQAGNCKPCSDSPSPASCISCLAADIDVGVKDRHCVECAKSKSPFKCKECLLADIDDEEIKPRCIDCANSVNPSACNVCLMNNISNKVKHDGCFGCLETLDPFQCSHCLAQVCAVVTPAVIVIFNIFAVLQSLQSRKRFCLMSTAEKSEIVRLCSPSVFKNTLPDRIGE